MKLYPIGTKVRVDVDKAIELFKEKYPDVPMNKKIMSKQLHHKNAQNLSNYNAALTPEVLLTVMNIALLAGTTVDELLIPIENEQ